LERRKGEELCHGAGHSPDLYLAPEPFHDRGWLIVLACPDGACTGFLGGRRVYSPAGIAL
jgi:hypothetical protein